MAKKRPLLAGFGKININPAEPRGMNLCGMPRLFPGALGIMHSVYARACYLESGPEKFLMIVCDLVEGRLIVEVRDEILATLAEYGGLKKENVWICFTHCHSSAGEWGAGGGAYMRKVWARYLLALKKKLIQVGKKTIDAKQEVSIGYGQAPVEGVSGSRRVKLSDGTVIVGWGDGPTPPPGVRMVGRGAKDKTVGLIVFKDKKNKPVGTIVNHSSHIHLYPVLYFTPELPGAVCQGLEKQFPGAIAVYAYGASGTTSLCENLAAQTQNPNSWSRQYNRERNKLAGRMLKVCKGIYKKMKFESRVNLVLDDVVLKIKNEKSGEAIEKLSAVCINNLALVGQVEEMAVEFILGVRALSRFPYTFTVGLNGVRNFYFPTTENMEAGGYEPKLFIEPGSMERVIREGGKLLNRVYTRMRR